MRRAPREDSMHPLHVVAGPVLLGCVLGLLVLLVGYIVRGAV